MNDDKVPTPASPPIDWVRADLRGEQRTLGWYVKHAGQGSRASAMRALQLCVQSLTPGALKQNGHLMTPDLVDALRAILGPTVENGDSPVLRAARGAPLTRVADPGAASIIWWRCLDMHQLLLATPGLSQSKAAAMVLDGVNGGEPASLQKRYRALKPEIEAHYLEVQQDNAEK